MAEKDPAAKVSSLVEESLVHILETADDDARHYPNEHEPDMFDDAEVTRVNPHLFSVTLKDGRQYLVISIPANEGSKQ